MKTEYNENGDDKLVGYEFHTRCVDCVEHLASLPRSSREWGEHLFKNGFITEDELNTNYKKTEQTR